MSTMGAFDCPQCGSQFVKRAATVKYEHSKGHKVYCSSGCMRKSRTTVKVVPCSTCGTDVDVLPSRKSKSGQYFCSHTCSATASNVNRPSPSTKHREKVSASLRAHYGDIGRAREEKNCDVCSEPFIGKPKQTSCSMLCGLYRRDGTLPLTLEELEPEVRSLVQEFGRVPSSKEVSRRVTGAAQKFHGSWNKMLASFGLPTNTEWMRRKRVLCKDGHVADSISEMLVDNWLFDQGIKHEVHTPYPEGRFTFDFMLPDHNTRIEYFGLAGEHRDYDEKIVVKRALAAAHGIRVIEVFPSHLYPINVLSTVILLDTRLGKCI